ncbi:hypothetical protein AM363_19650 [Citrobacter freundii]|uniref:Uncharacterized protein n=1 Tax=Citrobacter freundii TaxID=546 RepID=A0AB33H9Y0_CITFR|nr:hypothetical protein AM363_19650 [Citrobacter freundii]
MFKPRSSFWFLMKTIIETIHGNTRHAAPREFAGEAEEFDRDKGIKSNVQIRLIEIHPPYFA